MAIASLKSVCMRTAVLLIAAAALAVPVSAQQPQPYMMPPKPIADLVDAR